jgi:hypothetical protein
MTGSAAARGPGFCGWRGRQGTGERGAVRDCRRAYRDLERASGRLALIDRLAALLARSSGRAAAHGLLLVPGPDRPAVRQRGPWPGREAGRPRSRHRYRRRPRAGCCPCAGDRRSAPGRRADADRDRRRPAGLEVTVVVGTLHRIAGSEASGSHGRKLDLLADRRQSCRTDDRCAFIRLGDTVARFTVMPMCGHPHRRARWCRGTAHR